MKQKRTISRQRRWQLRQRDKGLCILCNEPAVTKTFCLRHAILARERERRRLGCKRRFHSVTYRLAEAIKSKGKPRLRKPGPGS